jgi:23S rRNA G2069 N7-methylase RlmK/C1962 C5-methylase RlmI
MDSLQSMCCFFEEPEYFNMNIVKKVLKDKKILHCAYWLEHDGADAEGFTSDLYDIYFVVEEEGKSVCYLFHVENYYHSTPAVATF